MRKQTQKKLLLTIKNIYQNIKPESDEELIRTLHTIKGIFKAELSADRFHPMREVRLLHQRVPIRRHREAITGVH